MEREEQFYEGEWWYKDPEREIWHKFQKEDYLNKIKIMYDVIYKIKDLNTLMLDEIEILKQVLREG